MSNNDYAENGTETTSDSSVINELRKQLKDTQKELSAYREAKLDGDRRTLMEAGFEKLVPLYEASLKGDPSLTASDFLETYGLAGTSTEVREESVEEPEPVKPDDVTSLSQRVAASATGGSNTREELFSKALNEATSSSAIDRLMAELGAG